jgi:hypothetical protein
MNTAKRYRQNSSISLIALILIGAGIAPAAAKDNQVSVIRCECLCVGPTKGSPNELVEIYSPNCGALNDRQCQLSNGQQGTRMGCGVKPNSSASTTTKVPSTGMRPGK